ncbi:MAG: hypothetical protein H7245_16190 [Candidatus Saccharibacteria bacterium]|nr:hypothetical protein [Pseudorhodobacter sp.]
MAGFLLSAEDGVDAFNFYTDAGQTYYDAGNRGIGCQTQTVPDLLDHFNWFDAKGGGGYRGTDGFHRVQRANCGDGKTATVLPAERVSNAGTQVFLIRIKGDALPDFLYTAAVERFVAPI